jgi:hypothetical protein
MSSNITNNQKKELIYVKIRNALEENRPLIKRSLDHSYLGDFNKVNALIKTAIINLEKTIELKDYITVIILTHPILEDIYIYSKEQWLLYYNFNIIEQCINNKTMKIEYQLLDKNVELKQFRKNKRKIIKYLIQNIPLKLFKNIFMKFLKENEKIAKQFECFFILELTNENLETYNKKDTNNNNLDDYDSNLNINIIASTDETEESSDIKFQKEKRIFAKLDEEYLLHHNDFLNEIEQRLNAFSDNQKNLFKIKEIIGDDDKSKIENNNCENKVLKTSLLLNLEKSISNMSLLEDDNFDNVNKGSNILLTQMTPPPDYVKKLLNDDNFFKKIDKNEYYTGYEFFKDGMNRELIDYCKSFS